MPWERKIGLSFPSFTFEDSYIKMATNCLHFGSQICCLKLSLDFWLTVFISSNYEAAIRILLKALQFDSIFPWILNSSERVQPVLLGGIYRISRLDRLNIVLYWQYVHCSTVVILYLLNNGTIIWWMLATVIKRLQSK